MTTPLFAIDTETGGLDPTQHALLSVAIVPSWVCDSLLLYILPGEKEIDPDAVEKNGYTPELWEERGAVPLHVAMELLRAYLLASGAVAMAAAPLAHNAAFDRGFLTQAEKETGVDLALPRRAWRCSQASYAFAQDAGLCPVASPGLDNLIAASGYTTPRTGHHCALEDARASLHGYRWLLASAKKEEAPPAMSHLTQHEPRPCLAPTAPYLS